jgi:hypothetical protein
VRTSPDTALPPRPVGRLTEAQYLDAQAEQAKAGLRATLDEIKVDLQRGLSPRRWTKDHPWMAMIASAAGGFATAVVLVPSKEQQELARLRRIHEALHPLPKPSPAEKRSEATEVKEGALGALLLRQVIGLIRPVISSLLSAAMTARPKPPEPAGTGSSTVPDPGDPAPIAPL